MRQDRLEAGPAPGRAAQGQELPKPRTAEAGLSPGSGPVRTGAPFLSRPSPSPEVSHASGRPAPCQTSPAMPSALPRTPARSCTALPRPCWDGTPLPAGTSRGPRRQALLMKPGPDSPGSMRTAASSPPQGALRAEAGAWHRRSGACPGRACQGPWRRAPAGHASGAPWRSRLGLSGPCAGSRHRGEAAGPDPGGVARLAAGTLERLRPPAPKRLFRKAAVPVSPLRPSLRLHRLRLPLLADGASPQRGFA